MSCGMVDFSCRGILRLLAWSRLEIFHGWKLWGFSNGRHGGFSALLHGAAYHCLQRLFFRVCIVEGRGDFPNGDMEWFEVKIFQRHKDVGYNVPSMGIRQNIVNNVRFFQSRKFPLVNFPYTAYGSMAAYDVLGHREFSVLKFSAT